MYIPHAFEQTDVSAMHDFIRVRRLGMLVTLTANGLAANHIPFVLDAAPAPSGVLRGHIARANPLWRDHSSAVEALVVFQGADAYISPTWYPSKRDTAKVVPTWNFIAVHAYGHLRFVDDAGWLREHLEQLTDEQEADRHPRWRVSDAPADFIGQMVQGVIGVELPISRLHGKWKLSQNRSPADRAGVIDGLRSEGTPSATALAEAMLRFSTAD
jgi:transcriptional regulator